MMSTRSAKNDFDVFDDEAELRQAQMMMERVKARKEEKEAEESAAQLDSQI